MFQAILMLVMLVIFNMIGRWALRAMGIIMIDSLAGILIKPTIWGMFIVGIGLGIIMLIFKGFFYILYYAFILLIKLIPVAIIIFLIIFIIRVLRNKR